MKMSDRRLKRILRENQLPVQPKKKEEMLEFARECDEKTEELEDGSSMKYIKMKKVRTLIAAAAILSLMAVAVTAGIVNYYYRTPGGKIVDQSGAVVTDTGNLSLKMTGEPIMGEGYTIEEVDWVSKDGNTTFTVWMTADSLEMPGLYARYHGIDYPLTKSFVTRDKDGNPLSVGYTAVNFPEPQTPNSDNWDNPLWVACEEPLVSTRINFEPEGVETVSVTAHDVTARGYIYDGHLYYDIEDHTVENGPLAEITETFRMYASIETVIDTAGKEHELERRSYSCGEGGTMSSFLRLPENVTPASFPIRFLNGDYYLCKIEGVTYGELPIPEIGETLTGEWVIFDYAGIRRTITEIKREKYSITYYSPEEDYAPVRNLPEGLFNDLVSSIGYNVSFFGLENGVQETGVLNTRPGGRMYRIASRNMNEFCEGRDSIRVGINNISTSYYVDDTGDWTLIFPEN